MKAHPSHLKLLRIDMLKQLRDYQIMFQTDDNSSPESKESNDSELAGTIERLVLVLRELLVDMPDQWDAHEELVRVHCDMRFGVKRGYPAINDDALISLQRSIMNLQQLPEKNRAPYLAEMLLLQLWSGNVGGDIPAAWSETSDRSDDSELMAAIETMSLTNPILGEDQKSCHSEMARLLMSYIRKFENKQCCFNDIKPYLASLSQNTSRVLRHWALERASALKSGLQEMVSKGHNEQMGGEDNTVQIVTDKLCRLSKLLQIACFLELSKQLADINSVSHVEFAHELLDLYCLTHKLGAGKGVGGLREVQPGDELLMLSSTLLRLGVLAYRKSTSAEVEISH